MMLFAPLLLALPALAQLAQQPLGADPDDGSFTAHDVYRFIDSTFDNLGEWEQSLLLANLSAVLPPELLATPPKPRTHRPASTWSRTVRGADVRRPSLAARACARATRPWARAVCRRFGAAASAAAADDSLDAYELRVRDPSELGVDDVQQYAGYLDSDQDKHLFYWFFESRNDPANDPVVLWLNGGPGCSSMMGLFMELGPSRVTRNLTLERNPHAWNANASVLFLDQPVNVGLSYSQSAPVSSTPEAARDMYALLSLFFHAFPQYARQPFYVAGESYAGHYVPVLAHELVSRPNPSIALAGAAIGNGLTKPLDQYEWYQYMACGAGGYPAVVDGSTCQSMENSFPRCERLIRSCYSSDTAWACVPATIYCNNALIGPYQRTGQNPYDVRQKCEHSNLCYEEITWIERYFNQPHVLAALGAEVDHFEGCNFNINRDFLLQGDWMRPFHVVIPDVVARVPLLVYAGDADFICNWLGNRAWTDRLDWPHRDAYADAPAEDLRLASDNATSHGTVKWFDNLAFARVFAAGHMVPYDQPEASLALMNRWMAGEWRPKPKGACR